MKISESNFPALSIMVILLILFGGNSLLLSQEHRKKPDEREKIITQAKTGDLGGVVTDDENTPLPGVTVKATSPVLHNYVYTILLG